MMISFQKHRVIFGQAATLFLCLIPWFILERRKSLNMDIIWMINCASRFLHGQTMTEGFNHEELPLATIVYIPAYLLSHYTGMSFAAAAFWTTTAYISLSCLAVLFLAAHLLKKDEAFLLAASAAVAGTAGVLNEFGQRDQILFLGLLLFVLGSIILTRGINCSRTLLLPVFAVGAVLVLLKPHHGLLPVLFLVHRAWVQKRWTIVRDMDFLAMAIATAGYVAVIWFFFNGWATEVFPDALRLYPMAYNNIPAVVCVAMELALVYAFVFLLYQM